MNRYPKYFNRCDGNTLTDKSHYSLSLSQQVSLRCAPKMSINDIITNRTYNRRNRKTTRTTKKCIVIRASIFNTSCLPCNTSIYDTIDNSMNELRQIVDLYTSPYRRCRALCLFTLWQTNTAYNRLRSPNVDKHRATPRPFTQTNKRYVTADARHRTARIRRVTVHSLREQKRINIDASPRSAAQSTRRTRFLAGRKGETAKKKRKRRDRLTDVCDGETAKTLLQMALCARTRYPHVPVKRAPADGRTGRGGIGTNCRSDDGPFCARSRYSIHIRFRARQRRHAR